VISFIANGYLWINNPTIFKGENEALFYKFKPESQ